MTPVMVMMMMALSVMVMTVMSGRIVGSVTCLRDAGASDQHRARHAEEGECPRDSLGHCRLLVWDCLLEQGRAKPVRRSTGHWS